MVQDTIGIASSNPETVKMLLSALFGTGIGAAVLNLWLHDKVMKIIEPIMKQHKDEDAVRCSQHKEDSKSALNDIKDDLKGIRDDLNVLSQRIFDAILNRQTP